MGAPHDESQRREVRLAMTTDAVGPKLILIDGYNVIRRTPGLAAAERVSLAAGRDALVAHVKAAYRNSPHHVVIVFDGDGDRERTEPIARMPRGKIIFAPRGQTADMTITLLARERRDDSLTVVIVSDDMQVRGEVSQHGGRSASVSDLTRKLNEPDRYRRKQDTHRRAIREQWRRDDEGEPRGPRTGNPRKAPKRTRGQRDSGLL